MLAKHSNNGTKVIHWYVILKYTHGGLLVITTRLSMGVVLSLDSLPVSRCCKSLGSVFTDQSKVTSVGHLTVTVSFTHVITAFNPEAG